jgi:type III pantothenate kinase
MAPSLSSRFELIDSLIFDGLLQIATHRGLGQKEAAAAPLIQPRFAL